MSETGDGKKRRGGSKKAGLAPVQIPIPNVLPGRSIVAAIKVAVSHRVPIFIRATNEQMEAMAADISTGTITIEGACKRHFGVHRNTISAAFREGEAAAAKNEAGQQLTEREVYALEFWVRLCNEAGGARERALTRLALGMDCGKQRWESANAAKILALTCDSYRQTGADEPPPAPPASAAPSDADLIAYAHRQGLRLVAAEAADAEDGYEPESAAPGNVAPG